MSDAPRTVTVEQIEAEIASEHYFRADEGVYGAVNNPMERGTHPLPDNFRLGDAPLSLLTFCVLVLRNGFTVTGQSACADPRKFDAQVGRDWARKDAVSHCWKLLGFRLRDELAAAVPAAPAPVPWRYTAADIADLRVWPLPNGPTNTLGQALGVLARTRDCRVFRTQFTPRTDQDQQEQAVLAVLKAANGPGG